MKKTKKLIITILILVLAIVSLLAFNHFGFFDKKVEEPIEEVIEQQELVTKVQPERQIWIDNYSINPDYQGELIFESNVINKPFVQAKDVFDAYGNLYHFYTENGRLVSDPSGYNGNDVYIWTNWKDMSYDYNIQGGSVFMDYRNNLDDQNIIIYGHHFSEAGGNDVNRNKAFTPLERALEEKNVDDFRKVKLVLDNETRSYELCYVYKYDVYKDFYLDKCQYYRCNYNYDEFADIVDNNYYQNYIDAMETVKLYDTGNKLTTDDNTLTLQTCISGLAGQVFEICVYKLVNTEYFD